MTYSSIVPGSPMARLGVPFVFGPLGSGQQAPSAARPLFERGWLRERARNGLIDATAAGLNPLAGPAVRRAATVLATNDATQRLARRLGARRVELMADTGLDPELVGGPRRPPSRERRRVLWVGRLAARKSPRLAVEAIARAARTIDVELHLAGDGPQRADVARWAGELGVGDRVRLHGRLPWPEVIDLYAASDALLFTSVQESLGSQLVEAAAFGLPIVTVDLHGAASVLPGDAAVKVPFAGVDETAAGLARGLVHVLTDEAAYARLSAGAVAFARSQTWPERVERMGAIYADAVDRSPVVR